MKFEELFTTLNNLNVNDKKEKRTNGKTELSYLSWTWAVSEFTKADPDFDYEIKMFPNENNVLLPYMYDDNTGYMVMTSVTSCGKTKTMWLPVMDGANNAMKNTPYQYKNKWGDVKTVEAATMFDINKTIMRCLTKNLAMFGLGLYIYAGEDLPEEEDPKPTKPIEPKKEKQEEPPKEEKQEEPPKDNRPQCAIFYDSLLEKCKDETKLKSLLKQCGASKKSDINAFVYGQVEKLLNEA